MQEKNAQHRKATRGFQGNIILFNEWEEYFNSYKSEINQLQIKIELTDKEIDQMVYQLYGLTDDEIAIVENSIK